MGASNDPATARQLNGLKDFVAGEEQRAVLYDRRINFAVQTLPKLADSIRHIEQDSRLQGTALDLLSGVARFLRVTGTIAPRSFDLWRDHVIFGQAESFPNTYVALSMPLESFRRHTHHFVASNFVAVENSADMEQLLSIGRKLGVSSMSSISTHQEGPVVGGMLVDLINWGRRRLDSPPVRGSEALLYTAERFRFHQELRRGNDLIAEPEVLQLAIETVPKIQNAFQEYSLYKQAHPNNDWFPGIAVENQRGCLIKPVRTLYMGPEKAAAE